MDTKITIVYDNEVREEGLWADWGFSCLVEAKGRPQILFDTGAGGPILLHNISRLGLDPGAVGIVVLSHLHWDHTGGLQAFLEVNRHAELFVPYSLRAAFPGRRVTAVKEPLRICENVFSTGMLGDIEQSLVVGTEGGMLVIVGCSHPGVGNIIDAASKLGKVFGIVGGFHGFRDFNRLKGLSLICPCHCTQYKSEIMRLFPEQCIECGAGLVLEA